MYSVFDLYNLTTTPRINDISLDLLRSYYELFLYPCIYHYTYEKDGINHSIELRFDKESLCHLLGLEKIVRYSVNRTEIKNFTGLLGWDNIEKGAIDFKLLKKYNEKMFNRGKSKFVYFYLIPTLVKHPNAVLFNKDDTPFFTNIECEILFYDNRNNAIVHLGIDRAPDGLYYFPRTFFTELITGSYNGTKYLDCQQKIDIALHHKTILL